MGIRSHLLKIHFLNIRLIITLVQNTPYILYIGQHSRKKYDLSSVFSRCHLLFINKSMKVRLNISKNSTKKLWKWFALRLFGVFLFPNTDTHWRNVQKQNFILFTALSLEDSDIFFCDWWQLQISVLNFCEWRLLYVLWNTQWLT